MITRISMAQPISHRNNKQRTNNYQSQVAFCANKLPIDIFTNNELLEIIINAANNNKTIKFIETKTDISGKALSKFKGSMGAIETDVNDMVSPITIKSESKSVIINNQVQHGKNFEMAKTLLKNIIPPQTK